MSQSSATKLIPKLRFKLNDRRNLRNIDGPAGRHDKIKKIVTALFKHERIETTYTHGDESRGYAERLIADAIRYGDCHKPTMKMASYWVVEKPIIHKLFKVLAPRYKNFDFSYTKMWRAPTLYSKSSIPKCILELRNNIYPPLGPDKSYKKNLIHNVLLEEAKKAYHKKKSEEAAATAKTDMKGKQVSAVEINKSQSMEGMQTETKVDNSVECDKISSPNVVSELSSTETLKDDSTSKSKSETTSKSETSSEADLDLSKVKTAVEKPKEVDKEDMK